MIIERTKDEVIFRLPANLDINDLQDMADWLEYMVIAGKSSARQEDVDNLVESVKRGRWERTKVKLSE